MDDLTKKKNVKRKNLMNSYLKWEKRDWSFVIFSDEFDLIRGDKVLQVSSHQIKLLEKS